MWTSDLATPPQGAFENPDGSVTWRIWAPGVASVSLILDPDAHRRETKMSRVADGYWEATLPDIPEGCRYVYRLPDQPLDIPDPCSRWQPDGVIRPSAVLFPSKFTWSDQAWRGVATSELVIYELHIGTFTPDGTFESAIARLPQLAELGITAIEIMPVSQFPGERNWGYDGVHPFAAQNSYGGPHGLQKLVDAAHRHGLAVILDVVYNHLGPEGNYFGLFGPYFTDRYHTPWGKAINYDGPDSEPVRRVVVDNACQWVRDFHVDGLRLDAVQMIFDFGAHHLLAQIKEEVQQVAAQQNRTVQVIAESDQNDPRLLHAAERGGYALDGVWADDFHHCVHTLLTGESDGYYDDYGVPEQLVKAYRQGFVYDGSYSRQRRRRHGARPEALDPEHFVVCIQNHDQIGNRARGDRLSTLLDAHAQRLAAGLLLTFPGVPLLYMGQEYGETAPFPFFCSFLDDQLIEAVRKGRKEEFATLAFRWVGEIPDPQSVQTFASARLKWDWPAGSVHHGIRQLHRDLLTWRKAMKPQDRHVQQARWLGDSQEGSRTGWLHLQLGSSVRHAIWANFSNQERTPPADREAGKLTLSTASQAYAGPRQSGDERDAFFPFELQIRTL